VTAVIVIGVALRVLFIDSVTGGDDVRYLKFAAQVVRFDHLSTSDHAAGRLLFLWIIGLPAAIGHAVYASAPMILLSLATDVVVAVVAYRRWGPAAALMAACVMAFCPLNIVFASRILPDAPLALVLLIAVLVLADAERQEHGTARSRQILIGGLLAGLAYMIKDPALLALPPAAACLILAGGSLRPRRLLLTVGLLGAGLLIMYLLNGLAYFAYSGDFFFKEHAIARSHNTASQVANVSAYLIHVSENFQALIKDFRWLCIPVFVGLPVFTARVVVEREGRLVPSVGLFMIAYLLVGSSSLTSLVPLPFHIRYFQPIVPLLALELGRMVATSSLLRRPVRATAATVILTVLALGTGLRSATESVGVSFRGPVLQSMRKAIELLDDEGATFFVHPCYAPALNHILPRQLHGRVKPAPQSGEFPSGLHLLVESNERKLSCTLSTRATRLKRFDVVLRVSTDMRRTNWLRHSRRYKRYRPALYVHDTRSSSTRPTVQVSDLACTDSGAEPRCRASLRNGSRAWAPVVLSITASGLVRTQTVATGLRGLTTRRVDLQLPATVRKGSAIEVRVLKPNPGPPLVTTVP